MLLKIYLIISITTTVLALLARLREKSKDIKRYKETHKTFCKKNRLKTIQMYLCIWIPILQLIYLAIVIWFLFIASDYQIIKALEDIRIKESLESRRLNTIINNTDK